MYKYNGYWFYDLRNDKIIQAKNLTEEYTILNIPQEYAGPFKDYLAATTYKFANPNLSKEFNQYLKDYYEFCYGDKSEVNIDV